MEGLTGKLKNMGYIQKVKNYDCISHDNQVDLIKPGEIGYKDKEYFWTSSKGYSATMRRSVRGHL